MLHQGSEFSESYHSQLATRPNSVTSESSSKEAGDTMQEETDCDARLVVRTDRLVESGTVCSHGAGMHQGSGLMLPGMIATEHGTEYEQKLADMVTDLQDAPEFTRVQPQEPSLVPLPSVPSQALRSPIVKSRLALLDENKSTFSSRPGLASLDENECSEEDTTFRHSNR